MHHNYMALQRDVTPQMRAILIDWLVEVAQEYHLSAETLHLCVYYTDRFLSRTPVQRSRLQLVGITCMLLACKFEEVRARPNSNPNPNPNPNPKPKPKPNFNPKPNPNPNPSTNPWP